MVTLKIPVDISYPMFIQHTPLGKIVPSKLYIPKNLYKKQVFLILRINEDNQVIDYSFEVE